MTRAFLRLPQQRNDLRPLPPLRVGPRAAGAHSPLIADVADPTITAMSDLLQMVIGVGLGLIAVYLVRRSRKHPRD